MNLILKKLACPLFLVLLGAVLFSSAVTVAAYPANQCAADRKGANLNCTANDVQITGMSVVGDTTSCIGGTQIALDLQAIVNFAVPDRYDIGIFISNDGKSPQQRASSGGAARCAVSVLPVASPFLDLDGMDHNVSTGDICGDGNGSIGGGTGSGIHYLTNVDVRCQSLTGAGGNLYIPFVLSWDNQASSSGALCTSNRDPVPNTTSKCNSPTVTQGSVRVVVLPAITQSDGVTTLFSGSSTNYSIVITNTTGVSLSNAVFTDPAVTGIAVNSLTCVAAGGASCPAGSTVAGMQGSGITIPAMPDGGSVTFTVNATLTGNPGDTRTNSASVTLGSQTNSASDTDTIVGTIAILPTTRSQNGDKDSAVVYSYTLYNFGVIADTISLAAVSGQGWTVTGSPALVTVPAGESKTVTVTVNIPDSASIGTVDTTTLTAVSGNNPSKTATATAVTTVTTVLTLMSNNTSAGGAGSSVYYNHRVQSNASGIKFVSLTPTFTSGTCTGWTSTLYESDKTTPLLSPVKLAASGGYKDFVLKVSIPSNAAASSTCTATLAAKDTSDAANTVSVTDATTVKALVLYQDPGYTTEQYTYPAGNNVYAKSFGLINGTPYYYKWYDPAGVLQRTSPTTSNLVSLPDTYTIPGTGPLGTWTVQLWDATANTIFAQTNFYVGPDHLKAGYTGANPDVNTNTVIDLTLHDKTNHVVPKDASGNLVKGGATDPKDPLIITVTVSGSATIVSTTLTNASIIGQSVTGRLDSTTGTATLTLSDSVSETVTVTPHSYNSALYGSPARDEPVNVTYTLAAPTTVAKVFSPSAISVNGTSVLTITLTNPNSAAIIGAAFTDTYPANLANTATPAGATTCTGGTVTAANGGGSVALSGGTVPANGSCTVTVNVTATAAGSYVNHTGTVTTSNAHDGAEATATLDVVLNAPTVTKSFSASSIGIDGTSVLTITLTNPNSAAITGAAFTDTYPANLANTATPAGATTCADGTVTAANGGGSVALSGGTVPANGSCTVTVNITSTALGSYVNHTGTVTTSNAHDGAEATATLDVVLNAPTVTKSFSASSIGIDGTSVLTITLTNPNSAAIIGVAFTDTYPANLTNTDTPAGATTCTGGTVTAANGGGSVALSGGTVPANGSCTVTVNVTATAAGSYVNHTGAVLTSNALSGADATATLSVQNALTVTADFNPNTIGVNGTSVLTITLTNPNSTAITGAAFTDTYPANLTNTATPAGATTCTGGTVTAANSGGSVALSGGTVPANGSCTVTVNVTSTAAGSYVNHTGAVTTINAGSSSEATATLIVLNLPTITVSFSPSTIDINGTSVLTITLTNPNSTAITGAAFTNSYPANLVNAGSPNVSTTCGGTVTAGSGAVSLSGGTIPADGSCTVTVSVTSAQTGSYANTIAAGSVATANAGSNAVAASATLTVGAVYSFNAFETSTADGAITGNIYTKLAGTAFSLDAVVISGGAQATSFNENIKVELLKNGGTVGSGYGSDNCPTASSVIQTIASKDISGGRSAVSFSAVSTAYRDVRVRISYPVFSPTVIICSTNSFSIRPSAFTITSTDAYNSSTTGVPVIKAGASFNLTATAVPGYDGTPVIDGNKNVIGTSVAGTLSGNFGAVDSSTGIATGDSFNYTEVGNFGLEANYFYDDTYTSIDKSSDCTDDFSNVLVDSQYGCKIGSNAVKQVTDTSGFGRFVPDHFTVAGTIANACAAGTFTYMKQPFTLSTVNVVEAQNAEDNVTQNYAGSYAHGTVGFGAENADNGTDLSSFLTFSSGSWSSGIYTLASTSGTFSRPATTVSDATWGPFESLDMGLTVDDSDVTTSPKVSGADMNPSVADGGSFAYKKFSGSPIRMRFGRLSLQNAYGSELLDLPMPLTAEYWDGYSWVKNTDDQCTPGITLSATDPIASDGLIPSELCVWETATGGNSGLGCSTPGTADNGFKQSPSLGNFNLNFRAPGSGNTGALQITATVLDYLKFNWKGAGDENPTARATFGIYKGNSKFIYIRELY